MNQILVLRENIRSIKSPSDLFKKIKTFKIKFKEQEHLFVFCLNTKNKIISHKLIGLGTLNGSLVHPREVFREAIRRNAFSIILAHNHPSGDLEPSEEDKNITKIISNSGDVLGIKVLDHIIFNEKEFYSLRESEDIF